MKRALGEYCVALEAEKRVKNCKIPDPDPALPEPPKKRTWQSWSNGNNHKNSLKAVRECPEGEYITAMKWSDQWGHGIVDVDFTCSGSDSSWGHNRATDNNNGDFQNKMDCLDKYGFRKVRGME